MGSTIKSKYFLNPWIKKSFPQVNLSNCLSKSCLFLLPLVTAHLISYHENSFFKLFHGTFIFPFNMKRRDVSKNKPFISLLLIFILIPWDRWLGMALSHTMDGRTWLPIFTFAWACSISLLHSLIEKLPRDEGLKSPDKFDHVHRTSFSYNHYFQAYLYSMYTSNNLFCTRLTPSLNRNVRYNTFIVTSFLVWQLSGFL